MLPDPYLEASHGKAWLAGYVGPASAVVSAFIVEPAWAHPFWSFYALSVIHLRESPGMPPAVISLPGATHEVYSYALNPEFEVDPDERPQVLRPANYTGQILCADDAEAAHRLEMAAQAICEGKLNPDTDALSQWVAWFGDSSVRK